MERSLQKSRIIRPAVLLVIASAVASCSLLSNSTDAPDRHAAASHQRHKHQKAATPSTSTPVSSPSATSPSSPTISPSGPKPWSEVFAETASGVLRIEEDGCDGTVGTGTGFLVGNSLVATVAHVVEGYRTLRITSPKTGIVTAGTVVGFDRSHDLALIQTDHPLPGHIFTLQTEQPPQGTDIVIVGFPLARSMQITTGTISGTHEHREVQGGYVLSDMLLTDGAANPGNSGGPWITQDEQVVALDESGPPYSGGNEPVQGNNGGVAAADAATHIELWKTSPEPLVACGPQPSVEEAAQQTLDDYLWYIDNSDYESAYAQLDSSTNPISDLTTFIDGVKSSQDYAPGSNPDSWPHFQLVAEDHVGGDVTAEVRFRSSQDSQYGPDGLTCADWHLVYSFVKAGGVEVIADASSAVPGQPAYQPCPVQ